MTFSLGSINFNTNVADGDGALWFAEVDGWDTMSNRVTSISLPGQHGGVTVQNLYESRELTLKGGVQADDNAGYWIAHNTLNSATNVLNPFLSTPLVLTISEEVDKQMSVLRTSLRTKCIGVNLLEFELTLRADDPFKYASIPKTVAPGTLANAGTGITYPVFTLTSGASPGTSIWVGSMTWGVTGALPSGTVIDMRNQTVLDGVTSYYANVDPASVWPYMVPGNNTVGISGATATVTYRDAWT